jgi:hypothetical protein
MFVQQNMEIGKGLRRSRRQMKQGIEFSKCFVIQANDFLLNFQFKDPNKWNKKQAINLSKD